MKSSRLVTILVFMNVLLIMFLVAEHTPSLFAQPRELPILRGRGLEIVDEQGLVRASITVHGPEIVGGRRYGGAVVLRMGDPRGAPGVKLAASDSGAGLGLSNGRRVAGGRSAGIEMHADDARLILTDNQGHEKIFRP